MVEHVMIFFFGHFGFRAPAPTVLHELSEKSYRERELFIFIFGRLNGTMEAAEKQILTHYLKQHRSSAWTPWTF
jgi:hypothetical protein